MMRTYILPSAAILILMAGYLCVSTMTANDQAQYHEYCQDMAKQGYWPENTCKRTKE